MWVRSQNKEVLADIKAFDTNKNKEKTMSVLDDLQCRIARSESGVFQMPEED